MPEMDFLGTASWKGGTECQLSIKGKDLVTVSPPPMFGEKKATAHPKTSSPLP